MADPSRWVRLVEPLLSVGAYPGESEEQDGKRRIMVGAIWLAAVLSAPTVFTNLDAGYTIAAMIQAAMVAILFAALLSLRLRPHRFSWIISAIFVIAFVRQLVLTALFRWAIWLRPRARVRLGHRARCPGRVQC